MKGKFKVSFAALFLLICVTTNVFAVTVFDKTGFLGGVEKNFADISAIFRVNCNQYYMNNQRSSYEDFPQNIKPYFENERIYLPLIQAVNSLNIGIYEENGKVVMTDSTGAKIDISGLVITRRNGVLYASAENIASVTGVYCKIYRDIVILSVDNGVTEVPEEVLEKFRDSLAYNWQNVYLGSLGYVTGIYAHQKKSEIVYCKTDVGGIYRLDREKNMWKPLMDGIRYPDDKAAQTVRSVAFDPEDENIIYVSGGTEVYGGASGLFKTTDGGVSWTKLDFPWSCVTNNQDEVRLMGESLMVDPNDTQTVFCGTFHQGLYVSHDGGVTWKSSVGIPQEYNNDFPGGVSAVYIDSRERLSDGRSAKIYAAVLGRGLYISKDGGASFEYVANSPKAICRMELVEDKLYMTATDMASTRISGGFFVYENGRFTDISPDSQHKNTMAMMINRNNPNMIIVVGAPYRTFGENRVFRTYDGGKTWEGLGEMRNPTCLLQDTVDENGIWWPYGAGIYYVKDMHAKRLEKIDADYNVEELVCTEVVSIPSKQAPVLHTMVMDHGHMRSETIDDKAIVTEPVIGRGCAFDYCEEDPSLAVRAGFYQNDPYGDVVISVSRDYGRTFESVKWIDKTNTVLDIVISPKKQKNGYPIITAISCGDKSFKGAGIYMSRDFGETWEKTAGDEVVKTKSKWDYVGQMLAVDRVNPDVYYYMEGTKLWRSMNGGKTWLNIYTFPKQKATRNTALCIKAVPGVEGGIWLKAADGIYVSHNFGKTFESLNAKDAYVFGFGKGKEGSAYPAAYLWGSIDGAYGLYLSDDMGKTWRMINDSTHYVPQLMDMCGDMNVYGRVFVATGGRGVVTCNPIGIDEKRPVITAKTVSSNPNPLSVNYAVGKNKIDIEGAVSEYCEVRVNGVKADVDGCNNFICEMPLKTGENKFLVEAADASGNHAEPVEITIRYVPGFTGGEGDIIPPAMTIESIPERTEKNLYVLKGKVNESAEVMVNRIPITVREDLSFFSIVELNEGANEIRVQARDLAKNACKPEVYNVTYAPLNKNTETLTSHYKSLDFVLDGDLGEWNKFEKSMDKIAFGNVSLYAAFDTMWDEEYLYIGVSVIDEIIYTGNSSVYNNDCVEIYIDGDNCKQKAYNENCRQYTYQVDDRGVDDNYAFSITDEGYTAELRIPWSQVNVDAKGNLKIGFDIDIVDNDSQFIANGERKGAVVWNGNANDWMDPSVFATLILLDEKYENKN